MEIRTINLSNGEGANLVINKMSEADGQIAAYRKAVEHGLNLLAQGAQQPQVDDTLQLAERLLDEVAESSKVAA